MLLLNDLRLAEYSKAASRENRARIAGAKRLERTQILPKLEPQCCRRHLRVDREHRLKVRFSQTRGRMFVQAAAEFRDVFPADSQPGGVRMAAEFIQQIAARGQPV